jgi:hypothetical protein
LPTVDSSSGSPQWAAFFVRCARLVLLWNNSPIVPPELLDMGMVCAVLSAELRNTS